MKKSPRFVLLAIFLCNCAFPEESIAQMVQQGSKLVGVGALGSPRQGISISLSSDGNTAIIGGPFDDGNVGAAWIFTRSGSVWSQQAKLVGTRAVGKSWQGFSVSLSSDGNTAIVGGPEDSAGTGAAWVFTRLGSAWGQEAKLVGRGAVGKTVNQGYSVSISLDGSTAIVGGPGDAFSVPGAAWVFSRNGSVWSQQAKLVGTGVAGGGFSYQGLSVALSEDGNTALVGGPGDAGPMYSANAAWVFTRNNDVWTEQAKLVGGDAVGNALQGSSVSLSSDGNTAIVGGPEDDGQKGATWIFTRRDGVWSQQGNKLVGSDAVGNYGLQGCSVSLSSDGNTTIIGGKWDNDGLGAAWIFVRRGAEWSQQGDKLVGAGSGGDSVYQGCSVSLSADGSTAIAGGPGDSNGMGATWVYARTTSGVGELGYVGPPQWVLEQNNPNPFNPSTTIRYELPKSSVVRLSVYDILGREVAVLVDERRDAGVHEVVFDASGLSSGVYFYRLEAGDFVRTRKLVVLR